VLAIALRISSGPGECVLLSTLFSATRMAQILQHRSVRAGRRSGRRKEANMAMSSVSRSEHAEGPIAKTIEQQTAKFPSDWFLWAAVGSIATSATLHLVGNKDASIFVGQWAPTFLILGMYNKLVKQLGSDSMDRARA
jgi:hypothetical protein